MTPRGMCQSLACALLLLVAAGCGSIPASEHDAADDPDPHDAASCPDGEVRCGDTCIDPDTSNEYCGASGSCSGASAGEDCLDAYACESGTCRLQCDGSLVACGDECIEPTTSLTHCGAADPCDVSPGEACTGEEICMGDHCELPAGACAVAGQYRVNDGPSWSSNPPTYTCRETCAMLFGGAPASYACSTTNTVPPNRQAFVEGYGISPFCDQVNGEDFKAGTTYNGPGTWSAYVSDHACDDINYCFTGACP